MIKKEYGHPVIHICRKCGGTGIENSYESNNIIHEDPRERKCTLCNGTGRVVVSYVKEIRIEAYDSATK